MATNSTSDQIAAALVIDAVAVVEEFVERYAPGFSVPSTFAGHLVGTDAVADLAHTLGLLEGCGVGTVAGVPIAEATATVLRQVDGAATHSFFSYRVAETLLRHGAFGGNPLLASAAPDDVDNVRTACDSTELLPLLEGLLPRNYLAVLARCETARARLGLPVDEVVLADLIDRTTALLSANPLGLMDESHTGSGRFDIYAIDILLFCEPLASELGAVWNRGLDAAFALAGAVTTSSGASVSWGRSTGALSEALTLELAGLAVRHRRADAARWVARAATTAEEYVSRWFERGVTTAHLGRSPEDYRGPQRRLQMTFDLLGKLAYSAAGLASAEVVAVDEPEPRANSLIRLDDHAGAWVHRDDGTLPFVLPLIAGRSADYLPAPRWPGLFETPVDSRVPCLVPVVHADGGPLEPQRRYAPGEAPSSMQHLAGRLEVVHDRWVVAHPVDGAHPRPDAVDGRRQAVYEVRDGALHVDEHLSFAEVPGAISVIVPSTAERPLRVDASGDAVRTVRTVDVGGMKEWQSAWGTISSVTEIELEPADRLTFGWSVARKSRVALTSHDAGYVRAVYDPVADPLSGRLVTRPWRDAEHATDVAHIHWPEWCFGYGTSVDEHAAIAARLRRQGTRIVWTQHNLTPHLDDPDVYDPIYQVWADACDLAIHHSAWGRSVVCDRYRFRDGCRHEVIAHPHFGRALTPAIATPRDEAAELLGLRSGAEAPTLRIGVIGAPRRQKDLGLVVDAVRASGRDDIELVVWSLSFTDRVPDDPRIVAHVYDNVDRHEYDLRLAACDAIALPFTEHTMLGTGTTSDLVAAGIPGLVTGWPYLTEYLEGLAVGMGDTVDTWARRLASLDRETLSAATAHLGPLRDRYDPTRIGLATATAIEALGVRSA